jgi:hypothetical protein
VGALIVDVVALAAIASRISEFGFTPNRTAALDENLVLSFTTIPISTGSSRSPASRRGSEELKKWGHSMRSPIVDC